MRAFHTLRSLARSVQSAAIMDISAVPAVSQLISHNGKEYTTIKEGLAHILIPSTAATVPQTTPQGENQAQSVFYNPIQQFNRDLSVLAIKAYGEEAVEKKKKQNEINRAKRRDQKKNLKRKAPDSQNDTVSRKAGKLDNEATAKASGVVEVSPGEHVKDEAILAEQDTLHDTEQSAGILAPENIVDVSESAKDPAVKAADAGAVPKGPKQASFTILDALSATGLRALRYAHEIPFTTSVTANDLLPAATESIKLNVQHNKLEDRIHAVTGNALAHMYSLFGEDTLNCKGKPIPSKKYDVIDLDPYGTAAPFLDAAVQSVRDDGGLLCVTCTDAGVWASNGYPEKCYSLYGGVPVKGNHSHEAGLRLILHSIATVAARYGMAIEPLLSLSIDFYARVFVRIHKSAAEVKFLAGKTMFVHNCDVGCGAWTTQMVARNKLVPNKSGKGHFWKHTMEQATPAGECEHCGTRTHLAGPMYAGPIQSPEFIKKILDDLPNVSKDTYHTTERIEGMLTVAMEETLPTLEEDPNSPTAPSKTMKTYDPAVIDHYPFLFIPSVLSKIVHCVTPHENALRGALKHLGYRVTRSHTKAGSIKTDAPWSVIWEVMREWVRQKAPVRDGAVREGTAGWKILRLGEQKTEDGGAQESNGTKSKLDVVFNEALGKEVDAKKLVRYQLNPRENWGPMSRASGH